MGEISDKKQVVAPPTVEANNTKLNFMALFTGILLSVGLTVSTMVDPARVIGFLDILGAWDPALVFVMLGAIIVYMPLYWLLIPRKRKPLLGSEFHLPSKVKVDRFLVIGAVTFGIGWGVTGICPGPAIANISKGNFFIFIFILSMVVGMLVASKVNSSIMCSGKSI
ncbi:hypothetical protein FX988_00468 [Paraglaciecola mesophila]|uniref:YeeE/YedE family protein n=2 Tax=Paraglaciecola mesophila TaxID=197222 RepID=A0A857JF00_9ALTE|nr:hypothetical protein FX988_00468 [Paraglaciecola mesophila]